jgi:hypothetical protein
LTGGVPRPQPHRPNASSAGTFTTPTQPHPEAGWSLAPRGLRTSVRFGAGSRPAPDDHPAASRTARRSHARDVAIPVPVTPQLRWRPPPPCAAKKPVPMSAPFPSFCGRHPAPLPARRSWRPVQFPSWGGSGCLVAALPRWEKCGLARIFHTGLERRGGKSFKGVVFKGSNEAIPCRLF